ncbi:hypothetical protein EYF80_052891 [Liparis tanakae]|uniref:Uncharacterized protein n=1 Tax=Liparis tanakae TaxID=230148 RepID=A0A4Z2F6Z3_9TELE|nr:hypothetical protein EYF80_052891 [Liparis tanakae]
MTKASATVAVPSPLCREKHRKEAQRKAQQPMKAVRRCSGIRTKFRSWRRRAEDVMFSILGPLSPPLAVTGITTTPLSLLNVLENFSLQSSRMSSFPSRKLTPAGHADTFTRSSGRHYIRLKSNRTSESPLPTHLYKCLSPVTCVEDAGGQRRREALVQQQFAEHHPGGLPGETPLQGSQPEVIEVSMETDGHDGHVASVFPVDALLLGNELVDEVATSEQAPVQSDVGEPGEPFGGFFQDRAPHLRSRGGKWCCTVLKRLRFGNRGAKASRSKGSDSALLSVGRDPSVRAVIREGLDGSTGSGNITRYRISDGEREKLQNPPKKRKSFSNPPIGSSCVKTCHGTAVVIFGECASYCVLEFCA